MACRFLLGSPGLPVRKTSTWCCLFQMLKGSKRWKSTSSTHDMVWAWKCLFRSEQLCIFCCVASHVAREPGQVLGQVLWAQLQDGIATWKSLSKVSRNLVTFRGEICQSQTLLSTVAPLAASASHSRMRKYVTTIRTSLKRTLPQKSHKHPWTATPTTSDIIRPHQTSSDCIPSGNLT